MILQEGTVIYLLQDQLLWKKSRAFPNLGRRGEVHSYDREIDDIITSKGFQGIYVWRTAKVKNVIAL